MLRRHVLRLATRTSFERVPIQITTQVPAYLSSRRLFSVPSNDKLQQPGSPGNAAESQSSLPKIIGGGLVLGSAFAAYYYGVFDKYLSVEKKSPVDAVKAQNGDKDLQTSPGKRIYPLDSELRKPNNEASLHEPALSTSDADHEKSNVETNSQLRHPEDSVTTEEDSKLQQNVDLVQGNDLSTSSPSSMPIEDVTDKPSETSFDMKSPDVKPDMDQHKATESEPGFTSDDKYPEVIEVESLPEQKESNDTYQVVQHEGSSSLLDDYYLRNNTKEETDKASSNQHEDVAAAIDDRYDGYISKDGKLVLDFLQAIHAAEQRQAELDARSFAEEKRIMKEKYEKELKDARARELMYAEREAILDKELNKERAKAAAALKSLQERLKEELKTELGKKETEAELKLQKVQELAKAELTAAISREKALQIEKMAEADLHINALCMAFYARSEEARQSHSVHKLALGALALEDAVSKGLPIQKEVEALRGFVQGIDKDSLLDLVLSSLPEDTKKYGTDTLSQLNHKFDGLKGMLRHFSLMPPGGGGILSHSLAHVASWLKVKEADQSGDGIESLINRVESLLAKGELCKAADVLENGVKGSQAAEIVDDWVRQARNRAVTEQALAVLQSYATSISLT